MSNKEFSGIHDHRNLDTLNDVLRKFGAPEAELRDIISYLIQNREHMRDAELERLDTETESLIRTLEDNKRKILLEEISCFKDILSLQRRLLEQNEQPRD